VPTARAERFTKAAPALDYLRRQGVPVVVKADGLAAGKGVAVCATREEAETAVRASLEERVFGDAGDAVLIEEFLEGEEASILALTDGRHIVLLASSQDHKRVFDADQGPNTGGMGAYSDSRLLTAAQRRLVIDTIIQPTIDGMAAEGNPFRGFLYAGLMMTAGGPKVLEYNVRLGDPETQCLLHRMSGDLAGLLWEACTSGLARARADFRSGPSVCIVQAAAGYPGPPRTGDVIHDLDDAEAGGAVVFHAGTKSTEQGIVTSGGRVLGITAGGDTLPQAIDAAYAAANKVGFAGRQMRTDIGAKGLARWRDPLQWKTSGGT
jgi:phosphoribosylamine--glycine ligase